MIKFYPIILSVALLVALVAVRVDAQPNGEVAIELSGFSVSEAYDLEAGDALDLSDSQLTKLLFRCAKVSSANFERWSRFSAEVSWQQLLASPQRFRFWTFKRNLTLRRLSQLRFPPETVTGEFKGGYLAQCTDPLGQPVFLIARSAPRKLTLNQPLEQRIAFTGFFYNTVAANADGSLKTDAANDSDAAKEAEGSNASEKASVVPLFIAQRFAWFPAATDEAMGVSAGQIELAARGVDVGLFDYVRKQNSKPLSQYDADAFYQMLAAANAMQSTNDTPNEYAAEPNSTGIGFTDLMSAPTQHFGSAITMSGRLRQCVPIQIVDADRAAQVGLKRYYQVSLFPDLGGRDVIVRTSGQQSIKFEQFPVTVCLPRLPPGMTADQIEGRAVEVKGHFYRFIQYQSKVSADAQQSGQVSPLVLASDIVVTPVTTTTAGVDLLMRVLLIVILAAVAFAVAYGIFIAPKKRGGLIAGDAQSLPEKIDLSQFKHQIDD